MHNIFIPVNCSKFLGWKHDFLEKWVGGCSSYDVTSPRPDLTRSKKHQKLRKGCLISYAKFQRDPSRGSAVISEKLMGVAPPPPLARVKIFLGRSNDGPRSGKRLQQTLVALSVAETRAAASPNSTKVLLKGWRRCHISKELMLSTGQGHGRVKWVHRMKI